MKVARVGAAAEVSHPVSEVASETSVPAVNSAVVAVRAARYLRLNVTVGVLAVGVLAVIALVAALYLARAFFVPFLIGILASYALHPLVDWLACHVPRRTCRLCALPDRRQETFNVTSNLWTKRRVSRASIIEKSSVRVLVFGITDMRNITLRKIFATLILLRMPGTIAGCDTMPGFGQDAERGGEKIQEKSARQERDIAQ